HAPSAGAQSFHQLRLVHPRAPLNPYLAGLAQQVLLGPFLVRTPGVAPVLGHLLWITVSDSRGLLLAHPLVSQRLVLAVVNDRRTVSDSSFRHPPAPSQTAASVPGAVRTGRHLFRPSSTRVSPPFVNPSARDMATPSIWL